MLMSVFGHGENKMSINLGSSGPATTVIQNNEPEVRIFDDDQIQVQRQILIQLKILNLHQSVQTDNNFKESEVDL